MKKQLEQLIESFKASGMTLTETQQNELNTFVESIETKINEAREEGKATAKEISIKLAEAAIEEYDVDVKTETEKLIEAIDKKYEKEIDVKISEALEKEKSGLVEKIDDYLSLYIKELIPESLVVDYDKLQRQAKALKNIRETLLITDDEVHAKTKEIVESINGELVDAKEKLNESLEKNMKLNKVIKIKMADELLESKIEDLPRLEANKLRKYFENSSVEDITEQFDTVYESISSALTDPDEYTSKISEIINEKVDEDEIIKEDEKTDDDVDPTIKQYAESIKRHH
jgi:hypothetical protein